MATDKLIGDALLTKTFQANEALAANRFVKLVSQSGPKPKVGYADGGEDAVGVTRDDYRINDQADVVMLGTAYVEVGGSNITAGAVIQADTDGKAEVATTADIVMGKALTDANAAGFVLVLLGNGGIY